MKNKQPLLLILTSVLSFGIGLLTYHYAVGHSINTHPTELSLTEKPEQITSEEIDSLPGEIDYSKILKGKYVLKGADWAGYEFIDSKTISWTNELFPMDPDTMRVKWINKSTFLGSYYREERSSARVQDIGQIVSFDGNKLEIKDINFPWMESPEHISVFYKDRYQ